MSKIKVIILEDNAADAKLIVRQIRKSDNHYKWFTVKDRAGFLEKLNSFSPDLILSDYSLPQFTGLDALAIAREKCPDTPFIMVTGSLNEEMAVECMRKGAWDYVLKEHLIYLNHAIDNCLKLKQQNLERESALKSLRENENRLSTLISNLPGFVYRCLYDEFWTMQYLSSGFVELTGYEVDELIDNKNAKYTDLIHPEDKNSVFLSVKEAIEKKQKFQFEYRLIAKDGSIKWLWEQGNAIFSENGEVEYLEGFVTDITERKKATTELQQNREKLRLMIDNSPLGFSATDLKGYFTDVNNAFCDMLDLPREEILGKHFNEFSHPDYHQVNLDMNKEIVHGERDSFDLKKKYIRKDGSEVLVSLHSQLVKDETGIPLFVIALAEDITEKTKAELELKQSEEQFRTFAENLPGFVRIYDLFPDGHREHVYLGPGLEEIVGKELAKKISEDPLCYIDLIPEEDIKHLDELTRDALSSSNQLDAEYRLKISEKNTKWVRARFAVQLLENNVQRWHGVIFNITEQKHTQQALLESEERFLLFMDHLPASVFIKDLQHKLIYANKYLKDNFVGNNWVGKKPVDIFDSTSAEEMLEKEKQAIQTGSSEFEQTLKDRTGTLRTFKTQLFLLRKDRSLLGGFSSDITEELKAKKAVKKSKEDLEKEVVKRTAELMESSKDLEESQTALTYLLEDMNSAHNELKEVNRRLQFSNKDLEAFAHSVSHDLRAPLRHINGFIELLYEHLTATLDKVAEEYFTNIKDSSKNMGMLIEQLLVFSRMGRINLNKVHVDHNEIIDEALKILKSNLGKRKITFDIKPLGNVYADPLFLRQVWVNLLSNAIKYTKNQKHAVISVGSENVMGQKETKKYFYIKDNGVGFDNNFAEKAFQVFQRLHSDSEYKGIGVGLANVSRIIQRHGGNISAEAEVDKGAKFYFYLPEE